MLNGDLYYDNSVNFLSRPTVNNYGDVYFIHYTKKGSIDSEQLKKVIIKNGEG